MPRPSPVRDVVRQLLDTDPRHAWTLDELVEEVRTRNGSADYSTVFRFVTLLQNEGKVTRFDLGDGRGRYELNDGHHEHATCVSCGRIAEIPGCLVDNAAALIAKRTGFQVTGHSLVFSGLCADCSGPA